MVSPSESQASLRSAPLLTPAFRRILWLQGCFGMSWSTYLLLPKFMAAELAATGADIGLVLSLPPAMGAVLIPFVGNALDRFGRRPVVWSGMLAMLLYAIGFLWVDRVGPYLYALQLLQGVAFTLTFNGAATMVSDLAPRERLGQAMGIFGSANVITNAVAPSLAEVLEQRSGWQVAFWAPIGAALAAGLLSLRLPADASPEAVAPAATPRRSVLRAVVYDMGVMVAAGAAFATVFTFYQPYALSLGVTEVRGFFIGFTAAVVLMRVGLGGVFERLGRQRVALASGALYVVVVLAVTQLSASTLVWLGAAYGLAHGVFYPTMNALAVEDVPTGERGRAMAFFNGGFQLGFAVCVVAVGPVADRFGYPAAFIAGSALAGVAFVMVALRRLYR